jgi:serine O-acetyltransferase
VKKAQLIEYTCHQINTFFPGAETVLHDMISKHCEFALQRSQHCIDHVRMWPQGQFNYLNSSQYCQYLYFLANTIWQRHTAADSDAIDVATRLFLLNKALNGIDLFYEIEMPEVFFIGHSVGIVLAKATYGNYLVLYQNSTVGKNHGVAPVLEEGVIMYPNSAIIGRCHIAAHTTISQGCSVINRDTPGHCIAFPGEAGTIVCKTPARPLLDDFFRL